MNLISQTFANCRAKQQTALISFITAGDGKADTTPELMHSLVAAGVDIIELGVPFSDPMADGKAIQLASARALSNGTNIAKVLAMVSEFRRDNQTTPVVLMGYVNPIENMGYAEFAKACAEAGVNGVLSVDLPPEEAGVLLAELEQYKIAPIFLIAPTSCDARIASICAKAQGFIYYVAIKGVTGSTSADAAEVKTHIERIKAHSQLPVAVGFGIKNAADAKAMSKVADAVVIGSAFVDIIAKHGSDFAAYKQEIGEFAASLRQGLDS